MNLGIYQHCGVETPNGAIVVQSCYQESEDTYAHLWVYINTKSSSVRLVNGKHVIESVPIPYANKGIDFYQEYLTNKKAVDKKIKELM